MFYFVFSVWYSIAFVTEPVKVGVHRSVILSDVIYTFWFALLCSLATFAVWVI